MWNTATDLEIITNSKHLRTNISCLDIDSQIAQTIKFISSIPYGSRTIDYYTPDSWPTPWEILAHRQFCTSSISLLAYYTITMVSDADISLHLVDDGDDVYLLPEINNKFLNYYPNDLVNRAELAEEIEILKTYTRDSLKPVR